MVQEDNPVTRLPPLPLMLGVAAAGIVSVSLVWLVGQQTVVALAYGGALVAGLLMLLLAARLKTAPVEGDTLQPDWSVTSVAIENRRRAVVIIDGRAPNAVLLELFTEHGAGSLIRAG